MPATQKLSDLKKLLSSIKKILIEKMLTKINLQE